MRLALFGATGRTGAYLLKRALDASHEVRALVRNPSKLRTEHPRLDVLVGDALAQPAVDATVDGSDAVLVALGTGDDRGHTTALSESTRNVVRAMEAHGISRIVSLLSGWLFYPVVPAPFEAITREHERQLSALADSPLDWVAVCPPKLNDKRGRGRYQVAIDAMPGAGHMEIARDDVAHFMLGALARNDIVRRRVGIADVATLLD